MLGTFLSGSSSVRMFTQSFNEVIGHGDLYIDVKNSSDEEVEFWYNVAGCWVINEEHYQGRFDRDEAILMAKSNLQNRINQGYLPSIQLNTNEIETEEQRLAREEANRIAYELRREQEKQAKAECEGLLTHLETVQTYEEVDSIEAQIEEKMGALSIYHDFSSKITQAKDRIKTRIKQEAEAQAWSELTEEIGLENAQGIKNGDYYVFQGQNKEWFGIGGPSNYLYNLDRDEKYCLTVQSETRIPEPDQILTKILWAKNNVQYVFDQGNVVGKLTDKLRETKKELAMSHKISIRSLLRNIGNR